MGVSKRTSWLAAAALLVALALSAKTISVLQDLTPLPAKKLAEGYTIEGRAFHYRDKRIDARAVYLTPEDRRAWFEKHSVQDPFEGQVHPEDNYVFFLVRFENLQPSENIEFTPGSSMFGSSNVTDETTVYQMFYRENDGDKRLAAAGKTMYFRSLHLPPGEWIERLLLFQYDETFGEKKLPLILSSILLGRDGIDLEFIFEGHFKKEKRK